MRGRGKADGDDAPGADAPAADAPGAAPLFPAPLPLPAPPVFPALEDGGVDDVGRHVAVAIAKASQALGLPVADLEAWRGGRSWGR